MPDLKRNRIYQGDVLDVLKTFPDECVQCCVTSPPYFGLRDYSVDGQMGLEGSPEQYLEKMVTVFAEERRVLKVNGVLWLNMGDCYAGSKNLVGMPWRLALALQADGWILRSDCIWHKPNPMPESVRDRPTCSHEYIFLLAKNKKYYYDNEAIKEPVAGTAHSRGDGVNPKARVPAGWDTGPGSHNAKTGRYKQPGKNSRMFVDRDPSHSSERKVRKQDAVGKQTYTRFNARWKNKQNESFSAAVSGLVEKRNIRSVWTIATAPYPEAHFATFPPAIVEPCVKAGSRTGDIVLDPFGGSGTTAEVAKGLGRDYVLIELNPDYIELAKRRLSREVQSVCEKSGTVSIQTDLLEGAG